MDDAELSGEVEDNRSAEEVPEANIKNGEKEVNEQDIIEVYTKQLDAMETGDEGTYMNTLSMDPDTEENIRSQFQLIQEIGAVIEAQEMEVTFDSSTKADLYVKQKMYTVEENQEFLDRILEVIYHMEKVHGKWKMVGSSAIGITFLEELAN